MATAIDADADVGEHGDLDDRERQQDAEVGGVDSIPEVKPQVVVTIRRSGGGFIGGPGVSCMDAECKVVLTVGSDLTLTAMPGAGYDFKSWAGCTSTMDNVCSLVDLRAAIQVTATFVVKNASLVVIKDGSGAGVVTASWSDGGLSCGSVCSASLPQGTQVSLTAAPDSCSTFLHWGGPCSGTAACFVSIGNGGTTVQATFEAKACCSDGDCKGNFACVNGSCSTSVCATGYTSCNGSCSALTSPDHCGSCGNSCLALDNVADAACASATCTSLKCKTGWGNCNPEVSDGCETDITTATNCRACGKACQLAETCASTGCRGNTVDCSVTTCAQPTCSTPSHYNVTNGIVVDLEAARRLWQRGSTVAATRDGAVAICRNLELEGITGWRLPSQQEFDDIVLNGPGIKSCTAGFCCPSIDQAAFPNTDLGWYWSSTDAPGGTVTVVDFGSGRSFHADPVTDGPLSVRCIHDPL